MIKMIYRLMVSVFFVFLLFTGCFASDEVSNSSIVTDTSSLSAVNPVDSQEKSSSESSVVCNDSSVSASNQHGSEEDITGSSAPVDSQRLNDGAERIVQNIEVSSFEKDKFFYVFDVIPNYDYNNTFHIIHFEMEDYSLDYDHKSIVIEESTGKREIFFEEVRAKEEFEGIPIDEVSIKSVYQSNRAFLLTENQLYFIFMAEMGYNRQTYQIYYWDLEKKQLEFVSQYPGCGVFMSFDVRDRKAYVEVAQSWIPGGTSSVIDLETGKEIERSELEDN